MDSYVIALATWWQHCSGGAASAVQIGPTCSPCRLSLRLSTLSLSAEPAKSHASTYVHSVVCAYPNMISGKGFASLDLLSHIPVSLNGHLEYDRRA
jgi:hypothetical protein